MLLINAYAQNKLPPVGKRVRQLGVKAYRYQIPEYQDTRAPEAKSKAKAMSMAVSVLETLHRIHMHICNYIYIYECVWVSIYYDQTMTATPRRYIH